MDETNTTPIPEVQGTPQATPKPTPSQPVSPQTMPEPKPEKTQDYATAILAAVEAATSKKEKTVVRSMAEQFGLTDEEAQAALNDAKAKKAKQLPPEVQAQIDAVTTMANDRLIAAEVKTLGVGMGLLDADAALQLMNREGVKVDRDGKISGVKEALEALRTAKAYLFKAAEDSKPKPTGEKKDVGGKVEAGGGEIDLAQFRRIVFTLSALSDCSQQDVLPNCIPSSSIAISKEILRRVLARSLLYSTRSRSASAKA